MALIVLRLLRSVFALLAAAGSASVADYKIQKGDTFYGIDRKNDNFTLEQLLSANPGVDPKKLQIGQSINFPSLPKTDPLGVTPKTDRLIQRLNANEGFRDRGYLDTKGVVTIGHGSTRNKRMDALLRGQGLDPNKVFRVGGVPISSKLAAQMRDTELARNRRRLAERLPFYNESSDNVKMVLQDMAYNMGSEFNFPKMFAAMSANDMKTAAAELMDSKYARKDVPNRARRNRDLLLGVGQ